VGSPISLIAPESISKVSVSMVDSTGKTIDGKLITHDNDQYVHATDVHFVPYVPLAAATKYTVTFSVKMGGDMQSFTTEFTTE